MFLSFQRLNASGTAKPSSVVLGEVVASINLRKDGKLGAREYLAYHKPDDRNVVTTADGTRLPLADSSTQYSYLYLAKWTAKDGVEMLLEKPISAHSVGLNLRCPRFDRDVTEFIVLPKKDGGSSWVGIITQVERTVIQVNKKLSF